MSRRILVAALGHAWLRDEAFGLKVIQALRQCRLPAEVELADWSFGTITAFQRLLAGRYDVGVFVAASARGRSAGVLHRRSADDPLPSATEIHARVADCAMGLVSLDNLLILGRFYQALPPQVLVLEAEPVDDTWGDDLSPVVAALVPVAVTEIRAVIEGGVSR